METYADTPPKAPTNWLDRPLSSILSLRLEVVLFAIIVIFAVFTRFYKLEARTMSHDETSHTYFSWLLSQGRGYAHDPVTHGPFQFHVVALSYFLFGDNDFTARIPAVLFSIATVACVWLFRRYLGKAGTLIAALMMLISPFMLYYGRYVRNEAFIGLFGLITLWSLLRYFDTGENRYLYFFTASIVMHFTSKETAYIYTAQALLFLAFYFIYRVTLQPWPRPADRRNFLITLLGFFTLLAGAGTLLVIMRKETSGGTPDVPAIQGQNLAASTNGLRPLVLIGLLLAVIALAAAIYFLVRGYGWTRLRAERSFDLLILLGALILPLLAAFPLNAIGWKVPINMGEVNAMTLPDIVRMASVVVLMFLISNVIGLWWKWKTWLWNFALFWGIFIFFYTTMFTNGAGLATGLVGSLGYWLAQQGVNRGSQPWYYYILVEIPVYEYLPALGCIIALALVFLRRGAAKPTVKYGEGQLEQPVALQFASPENESMEQPSNEMVERVLPEPANQDEILVDRTLIPEPHTPVSTEASLVIAPQQAPFLSLMFIWIVTSIVAFSVAGEKMPWLTFHITWPMILLAGWSIGVLVEETDWKKLYAMRGILILVLLPVFLTSLAATLGSLLGTNPPFQGKDLVHLQATSAFITAFLGAAISGWGLFMLLKNWSIGQTIRLFGLTFLVLLALLTARTAFTANYINYNYARELLVYAHSGAGAKEAMAQIDEISQRITNGQALQVAYDNETSYPFWWYLRNYPNQLYFGNNPTRDLRNAPVILVGDANYSKVDSVIGNKTHDKFEYIRMWWPDQGYFNLTRDRILNALSKPEWRAALFQIWLNRDYTRYGQLINKDMSLPNWDPANRFRLYIRKDIVSQIWNYGASPSAEQPAEEDVYAKGQINLSADTVFGSTGVEQGQYNQPRGVAVAPDGSLYITDTGNHRIQHLKPDGTVLQVWGKQADVSKGDAPGGTFNEPWGVAVGPDGSVYIADTWNHRIQKFTADGQFITMWGYGISQTDDPFGFYGPRGIAVDSKGNVFVTDTGNKRVVVFDSNGKFITKFGSSGSQQGQFEEPVGIALDTHGNIYVADTWNQRIQVFTPGADGAYTYLRSWDINGWFGQSVNNYPYLTVDNNGHVFATDPEGFRVLEFNTEGQFLHLWGDYGTSADRFTLPNGIAIDPQGGVWVVDSGSSRIMHFIPPAQ
jgi:predicted membrane-bound mannosyltransferase/DNA-binding beta-propeller fold protein YncE